MKILALDFETYFDKEYSLDKLTTEAYVRDLMRFQILGCGFRLPFDGSYYYADADDLIEHFKNIPWDETAVLCHHAQFDCLILSHHFGIKPRFIFDTMAMARLVLGPTYSVALGALAKTYGLGGKTVPYQQMKGVRHENLTPELRAELEAGCLQDVWLTWELFTKLLPNFPEEELRIIDMTVRWFTEPVIKGDEKHYEWLKEKEWLTKNEMLSELGTSEKELGSNARFAAMLAAENIDVEMKPGKNGPIPAFAKTDEFMKELLDHDNSYVAALAEARLAIKSTIDETRAAKLAAMAQRGPMTVYINYAGARNTLRWSGGDGTNWQNFRRTGELRKGLYAPKDHLFGVVDKSQVECRFLNYLAGEQDAIEQFRTGADPYIGIASQFYGRPITKENGPERGLGKQLVLSCGYGAGGTSIVTTAKRGSYGPPVVLTEDEGRKAAVLYRNTHPGVTRMWEEGNMVLRMLHAHDNTPFHWHDCAIVQGNRIFGPNGSYLTYNLEWDSEQRQWYRHVAFGAKKKIWGGVVVQNLMEFLCRINLAQGLLSLVAMGIPSAGTSHDEAWFIHPASEAAARHDACIAELSKSPAWLPDIPLAVEGHLGERYEK